MQKISLFSIIRRFVDDLQRVWHGEDKTFCTSIGSSTRVALPNPPVEIMLSIVSYLDSVTRILLSLCSKRLRVILTAHYDLSLKNDMDQKFGLLLLLERDLPELLICRSCVSMFQWRQPPRYNRPCINPLSSHRVPHMSQLCHSLQHYSTLRFEIVDLVLRAHHYGPDYGLPASCLNHECSSEDYYKTFWRHSSTRAAIIENKLFVARSCIFTADVNRFLTELYPQLSYDICLHKHWRLAWQEIAARGARRHRNTWESETWQCKYCTTDLRWKLHVWDCDDASHLQAEFYVWQDYGSYQAARRCIPMMFNSRIPYRQQEDTNLPVRDLEHDFNAGWKAAIASDNQLAQYQ